MNRTTKEATKSRFELFVELVKAIAWPLLAAVVLVSFWHPLREAANQLPSIVSRSDTITILGLSLKIGPQLRQKAPREVQEALAALSADGIKTLMGMIGMGGGRGNDIHTLSVMTSDRGPYAELIKLKLAEEVPGLARADPTSDPTYATYVLQITPLGVQTNDFLLSLIAEFIDGLKLQAKHGSSGRKNEGIGELPSRPG
jgi:hypothetical protein